MSLPPPLSGDRAVVFSFGATQHRHTGAALGAQDPHEGGTLVRARGDPEALWAQRPVGLLWPCLRPVHVPSHHTQVPSSSPGRA